MIDKKHRYNVVSPDGVVYVSYDDRKKAVQFIENMRKENGKVFYIKDSEK